MLNQDDICRFRSQLGLSFCVAIEAHQAQSDWGRKAKPQQRCAQWRPVRPPGYLCSASGRDLWAVRYGFWVTQNIPTTPDCFDVVVPTGCLAELFAQLADEDVDNL